MPQICASSPFVYSPKLFSQESVRNHQIYSHIWVENPFPGGAKFFDLLGNLCMILYDTYLDSYHRV